MFGRKQKIRTRVKNEIRETTVAGYLDGKRTCIFILDDMGYPHKLEGEKLFRLAEAIVRNGRGY